MNFIYLELAGKANSFDVSILVTIGHSCSLLTVCYDGLFNIKISEDLPLIDFLVM